MSDLTAAEITEGQRLLGLSKTSDAAATELLLDWVPGHLRSLLDAAEKLARVCAALANHPRVCDVHPDDDVIKCGWKRTVASIQSAINPEENR